MSEAKQSAFGSVIRQPDILRLIKEALEATGSETSSLDAATAMRALSEAGLAIVPVEPTEAMEIAGGVARDFDGVKMPSRQRAAHTYRAMIRAAQES